MSKGLKVLIYILTAVFSFIFFLYITFPFDFLKDRIIGNLETTLNDQYQITVASVSPKLIVGVSLKGVKILKRDTEQMTPVFEADRISLKAGIFSLLIGRPTIKYEIKAGGGYISGKFHSDSAKTTIAINFDNFDVGKIPYLMSKFNLIVKSELNGDIKIDIDQNQLLRSSGMIKLKPGPINIMKSKAKMGSLGELDVPDLQIGGSESLIDAEVTRGAIKINSFKLAKGDFDFDLTGAIYLSANLTNFRLNLNGGMKFSDKVTQTLPFLFIIEKQKKEDGTFPITVAGRLSRPQIKIGDFTLPL